MLKVGTFVIVPRELNYIWTGLGKVVPDERPFQGVTLVKMLSGSQTEDTGWFITTKLIPIPRKATKNQIDMLKNLFA